MPGRKPDRIGAKRLDLMQVGCQRGGLHLSKGQTEAENGVGVTQRMNAGYCGRTRSGRAFGRCLTATERADFRRVQIAPAHRRA